MPRFEARLLLTALAPGALGPVFLFNPAWAHGSPLSITVHAFDYSGTHPASIADAQKAAGLPFRQAGIDVRWLNCPVAGPDSAAVPECETRSDATHFVLVILPEHMARKMAASPRQFGLAVLSRDGGFPNHAYVFLHRAVDLSRNELVPWAGILGHLMAHELGHLLLGTNSHFPVGIMRASWRTLEMKQALMGNLSFTPEQAARMRDEVRRRRKAGSIPGESP
jgi:hypothetical protein